MKFRFGRRRADADANVRSEVGARNAPEYERIALSYKGSPSGRDLEQFSVARINCAAVLVVLPRGEFV